MPPVRTPHLRFPIQRDPATGKLAVVEQDSRDHIMTCENVITACPLRWRDERPEFGWPFPTFRQQPINSDQLTAALRYFEPRSTATGHDYADAADAAIAHLSIDIGIEGDG